MTRRARDLGISPGAARPGSWNAITDVPGVRVGQVALIEGEGPLEVGRGPVRTGVTVVLPRAEPCGRNRCSPGCTRSTATESSPARPGWRSRGLLMSAIAVTSAHAVGVVRDALIAAETTARPPGFPFWRLPVVAETWDGVLHDINDGHVTAAHVHVALASATDGPVAEGNIGGGRA